MTSHATRRDWDRPESSKQPPQDITAMVRAILEDVVSHFQPLHAALFYEHEEHACNADDRAYYKHEMAALTRMRDAAQALLDNPVQPIPMVLFCRACGTQHIDKPDEAKGWTDPPHRSHECQHCGYTWRPADVPTRGVESIATKGTHDGSFARNTNQRELL